jgi:hypothetical protein
VTGLALHEGHQTSLWPVQGVTFDIKWTFDVAKKGVKADRSELPLGYSPSRGHGGKSK